MRSRRSGEHRPALDETADADLVERSRAGDTDAFGELWRRHYPAGIAVARSITSSLDADDLVQEAYTRIYRSIQRGGGPTGAFRAYLFTSIRNTAAAWGRARRESTIDELEAVADPATEAQAADDALDRGLTHQAFRSLPTRWQEVLWYTEIEQMRPAEVAPLLGMKANAVAQLAVRAREGLRAAWVQAHLRSVADGSECQWTIERLGAHARGTLGKRDRGKVDAHLHDCARCAIVAGEAKDVSDRLALVLLPLTLGAGAAGYAAWLQSGASVATVAGMPSAVVQGAVVVGGAGGGAGGASAGGAASGGAAGAGGAGASSGAGTSGGSGGALAGAGAVTGLISAGVLVAATVAVAAVVVSGGLFAPATDAGAQSSANMSLPKADASDADVTGQEPDPDHLPSAPEEKRPTPPPVAPAPPKGEPPAVEKPVVEESAPAPDEPVVAEPVVAQPPPPGAADPTPTPDPTVTDPPEEDPGDDQTDPSDPGESTDPSDPGETTDPGETDPGGTTDPGESTDPGLSIGPTSTWLDGTQRVITIPLTGTPSELVVITLGDRDPITVVLDENGTASVDLRPTLVEIVFDQSITFRYEDDDTTTIDTSVLSLSDGTVLPPADEQDDPSMDDSSVTSDGEALSGSSDTDATTTIAGLVSWVAPASAAVIDLAERSAGAETANTSIADTGDTSTAAEYGDSGATSTETTDGVAAAASAPASPTAPAVTDESVATESSGIEDPTEADAAQSGSGPIGEPVDGPLAAEDDITVAPEAATTSDDLAADASRSGTGDDPADTTSHGGATPAPEVTADASAPAVTADAPEFEVMADAPASE